ncbi:hypothetical protein GGS23DRAFT_346153 [Durotheca rogersii]|uniref:uncharacterized protein n=1 Tax=Durotheca rogersii TaxID=419775 RepID=UPI00221EF4A6|nr:uncharacterized protein GGS23DRAFT_346153 [Durotheca rogersii]KAI5857375.1 hypothetical protein GGS23DRAFT_346153 [Durotheca rogersii]
MFLFFSLFTSCRSPTHLSHTHLWTHLPSMSDRVPYAKVAARKKEDGGGERASSSPQAATKRDNGNTRALSSYIGTSTADSPTNNQATTRDGEMITPAYVPEYIRRR